MSCFSFFFTHTEPTDISTLSLHDALPILASQLDIVPTVLGLLKLRVLHASWGRDLLSVPDDGGFAVSEPAIVRQDRKSTRLNSSHQIISYAVFCLKKKKKKLT